MQSFFVAGPVKQEGVPEEVDLAVIGAGPAGLTAAIYATRYKLKTAVFGEVLGGLVTENPWIENYPGFKLISGQELASKLVEHAKALGALLVPENVKVLEKADEGFLLTLTSGKKVRAKAVVIATGLERRKLNAKNEDRFLGKGVSYCATCDAAFFKDKVVAVVGGGDSAAVAALLLAEYAKKVYLIYRRERFRKMQPAYVAKIMENPKIEPVLKETVVECLGKEKLEAVKLSSGRILKVDGLFVEIGFKPRIPFELRGISLEKDERGFIKVDAAMRTSEPGIFAAGDITTGSNYFQQIITAAAEGAIAADSAYKFILGGE